MDLRTWTGLGTSRIFAARMLNAFYALKGKDLDKQQLAADAIRFERELRQEAEG